VTHRIDIPSAPNPAHEAAGIVMAMLREVGIDPRRAINNPIMQQLSIEWVSGRFTKEQFCHACRNMLIFNPSLAL
jgi:hypothetical protein